MIAFAKHQHALAKPVNGRPTRDHLRALAKRSKAAQAELDGPPCPEGWRYLWDHFRALDRWRGGGGMGLMPLTLHDLDAYERRYRVTFSAGEADVLKALDAERLVAALPEKPQ